MTGKILQVKVTGGLVQVSDGEDNVGESDGEDAKILLVAWMDFAASFFKCEYSCSSIWFF